MITILSEKKATLNIQDEQVMIQSYKGTLFGNKKGQNPHVSNMDESLKTKANKQHKKTII